MKRIVSLGLVISFITICLVIPTNINNQSRVSATSLHESITNPDLEREIVGRNPERFEDPSIFLLTILRMQTRICMVP